MARVEFEYSTPLERLATVAFESAVAGFAARCADDAVTLDTARRAYETNGYNGRMRDRP